ncbi:type VI secretion system tip protein VgrG [Fluviicola sp.]|uniref:type VI secretion system tip protein VgrG n=1 Tax=Fluviicola sp. TaxID=1917219 RepID=UPI0026132082|nr:type VI secretion system tip protein VgrG [Fluviicola sp.]
MNNTGIIQTGKSPDLVTYQILIEEHEIPGTYPVLAISVRKEFNRIATARITFYEGTPSDQNFKISNSDFFVPGKKIQINAGYHSENKMIFKGIIIRHSIKVRNGKSSLVVECKDEAVKMTIGRKSKFFYDSTDSDVFDELIKAYSLEKKIEKTNYQHEKLVQYNASDWDFLVSRAQTNGMVCFTDNGKILIGKPDPGQSPLETVAYGMTIMEFDAEIDARNQFSKVTAYSWNQADQEISKIEANNPPTKTNGNLDSEQLAKVIGLKDLELKYGGNLNETEAQDWANSKMMFQQMAKVRGRVRFQGIDKVNPGTVLKLEGISDRFNGNIFVSGVQHNITSGLWTVDAQFGLDPVWFSETYDMTDMPASGLLPAVRGLQYGVVSQLEDDPLGECRIMVKLPIVNSDEQGIWCRVATLDAGENRGSFFLPEIGDEVLVGFINEDPNNAVIVGMLNSSAKPAPLTAEDANNIKGFVTRSEMKFLFDDDKKSVTIETPAGKKVIIDEDAGEITLQDENSNTLKMNKDGISIESGKDLIMKATGDVKIEGMNIEITGQAEVKASGSAGTEVSSSATTTIKGSIVQIN